MTISSVGEPCKSEVHSPKNATTIVASVLEAECTHHTWHCYQLRKKAAALLSREGCLFSLGGLRCHFCQRPQNKNNAVVQQQRAISTAKRCRCCCRCGCCGCSCCSQEKKKSTAVRQKRSPTTLLLLQQQQQQQQSQQQQQQQQPRFAIEGV